MSETSNPQPGSVVARLVADEHTARAICDLVVETFDAQDVAGSLFEVPGGSASLQPAENWAVALHFRMPPNETAVRALVALAAGPDAANALAFEAVEARDWIKESHEALPPVVAGRFVIHGAHDRARIPPARIAIEIEAALAFGTGHHGTTRGCLLALNTLAKSRRFRRVLDVGAGSGVLAIAAAKILRARVLASDIDPRAVAAARANARNNRVGHRIEVFRASGLGARRFRVRTPFDLVFANILLEPVKRLAGPMTPLLARNACVVLSGLLTRQENAAVAPYSARGLALRRRIRLDGWSTLVVSRRHSGRRARRQ